MPITDSAPSYRPKLIETAFIDFISDRFDPFWSPVTPRVKLVSKVQLNDSLIALELAPNPRWLRQLKRRQSQHSMPPLQSARHQATNANSLSQTTSTPALTHLASPNLSWQAGQHITLSVKISSIYYHRSYSLVGTPLESPLHRLVNRPAHSNHSLYIAIKPQGLVSNYLANHARIGDVFDCELPEGEFTLIHQHVEPSQPLGFIASGSGITPMPGLINHALQTGDAKRPVTLVYYYAATLGTTLADSQLANRQLINKEIQAPKPRNQDADSAAAFVDYWQLLANRHPNFRYYLINTLDSSSYIAGSRHLNAKVLKAVNLHPKTTKLFACGAPEMMQSLQQLGNDNLVMEYFEPILVSTLVSTPQYPDMNAAADTPTLTISLRRRQRQIQALTPAQNILNSTEAQGITLPHGCRQGICNMCRCDKISGVVKNLKTGKLSEDGFESIKPCVSLPMTDVILDI